MTDAKYTPSHIANFFLQKGKEEKMAITQLKLMKLVYLGYGWVLATLNSRLFCEEIEAWKYGPVVPSLYHEFKHFGYSPINEPSICFDLEDGTVTVPHIDTKDKSAVILEKVWDIYKHLSASALVQKTHEPNSPWHKHYDPSVFGKIIPDDDIKAYFKKRISEYLAND